MRPLHLGLSALLGLVGTLSRADIAPTTFAGGALVPVEISDLRFDDAHVRITWGTPCKLDATFDVASDRHDPVALEIGFPVGGYDPHHGYDPSPEHTSDTKVGTEAVPASIIEITINGSPSPAFRRIDLPKQCEIRFGHASWYFTNATLVPGKNRIEIKTFLRPSGVYCRPFERELEYCLWTGGRWNGRIKHETIEVVFPSAISDTLIQEVKPEFFEIRGNRLVWDYTDIEPKDDFFDIRLVVQIPEIAACVAELEQAHSSNTKDTQAALRLARHLFLLGYAKGNSGFPPESIPVTEYYRLIDTLNGDALATFERHYSVLRGESVMERTSEWTDDRVKVIQILADAGFCDNYSGVRNVLRAKRLLEEVISREPRNEAAWLMLLENYWRFSFAAKGHWFGPTVLGRPQINDIQRAARHCPESKAIQAWLALLNEKPSRAESRGPATPHREDSEQSEFAEIMKKYGSGYD